MGLLNFLEASCAACTTPTVLPAVPDICDVRPEGVAPVAIGFITCDTTLVAPITLAQIQALVTANDARFKRVWNFVANETEVEEYEIDPFSNPIPVSYTKTFAFDDPYFDRPNKTDKTWWDYVLNPSRFLLLFPVLVFDNDRVEVYRSKSGYKLKVMEGYDSTARTNKVERKFEMSVKWTDNSNKSMDWLIVPGISALYGH